MQAPKIVFLHGLESGPNGYKASYLRSYYPELIVPELSKGLPPPDQLAKFLQDAQNAGSKEKRENGGEADSSSRLTPRKSLQICADIAYSAMKESDRPVDILCGSSWGGAVALWLMSQGLWKGPAILIAPALKRVLSTNTDEQSLRIELQKIYSDIKRLVKSKDEVIVVHGTDDDVIPIEDSRELCAHTGFRLVEILHGDHPLNEHLIKKGFLLQFVRDLAKKLSSL